MVLAAMLCVAVIVPLTKKIVQAKTLMEDGPGEQKTPGGRRCGARAGKEKPPLLAAFADEVRRSDRSVCHFRDIWVEPVFARSARSKSDLRPHGWRNLRDSLGRNLENASKRSGLLWRFGEFAGCVEFTHGGESLSPESTPPPAIETQKVQPHP